MRTRAPLAASGPGLRQGGSLGGLVPCTAVARSGETAVLALCLEVHAEGAVLPVLVLSEAPGLLGWDPVGGLEVHDDSGRAYDVARLGQQAGLGVLQTAAWIAPAPPPDARRLVVEVRDLVRTSAARGGGGVERALAGGPWGLTVDLVPERTGAPVPPAPAEPAAAARPARVPARVLSAFAGLTPVGQARVTEGAAVCLWALERYRDRAVLSVSTLADDPVRVAPLTPGHGRVEVWDDRGGTYAVAPIHGLARPGWSETSLEVAPAVDPRARSLGVRLSDLPVQEPPSAAPPLAGPFTFGVAVGPART